MKKNYPNYDNIQEVFDSLSKTNQKIITDYILYCKKDAGESTLKKYFLKIVQIADVLEKDLDKLKLNDVLVFLSVLNGSNRGTDTKNDLKKTIFITLAIFALEFTIFYASLKGISFN